MSAISSWATRTCCAIELHACCRTGIAACRATVALNKQDGWAVHAVAHVMEMQGRAKEGADFLEAGADGWAPNSMFAFHLWWHKALFHFDANDAASALKLFDEKISAAGFLHP